MSDISTSSETIVSFVTIKCSDGLEARLRSTQRSDEIQHLGGVPAGIDAVEHVPHGAVLVDDESGARDAGFPGSVGFLPVHHAVVAGKLVFVVGEIRRFQRAVGRAVLGIEIEHDVLLAPELAELDRFHVRVGKREKRRRLPRLQHVRRAFGRPERRLVCSFQVFLAGFKASTDYNRGDENATAGWAERRKISVTILAKETAAGPKRDYRL